MSRRRSTFSPSNLPPTFRQYRTLTLDKSINMKDPPQGGNWRRACAEFIMADLELASTFLDLARTLGVTENGRRNQKNARTQPVNFILSGAPSFVTTADFNLDGKPDIAALYYSYYGTPSEEVTVLTNTTP